MTQAISVCISKAIFGPAMSLNLEQQKYITIWNKTTTTHILGVSHLFYIQWRICGYCNSIYEVKIVQPILPDISLHTDSTGG